MDNAKRKKRKRKNQIERNKIKYKHNSIRWTLFGAKNCIRGEMVF